MPAEPAEPAEPAYRSRTSGYARKAIDDNDDVTEFDIIQNLKLKVANFAVFFTIP